MTETDASKRRWGRRAKRFVVALLVCYVLGCAMLYFLQDRLVFVGHRFQGTEDVAAPLPGAEKVRLTTAGGTPIVARFRPGSGPGTPTVLFFYGNAMCAAWCDGIVEQLHEQGCNVLVPDYVGYGESGGTPSEAGCYATADAAWQYLRQRPGVDPDRIVVMGWSLGSAVAIDLASRVRPAGLITVSAFTRISDVAAASYPFVPVRLLLRPKFVNVDKAPNVRCPVLQIHGKMDTLVAPALADRLSRSFGNNTELLWLPAADHNTMFEAEPALLGQALKRFLGGLASPHP